MAKNVIATHDVRVCLLAVDNNELVWALVIPQDVVNPIDNQLDYTQTLSCWCHQVDLAILVLYYYFWASFVGENLDDVVVGLMLENEILVINVEKLETVSAVKQNEEVLS